MEDAYQTACQSRRHFRRCPEKKAHETRYSLATSWILGKERRITPKIPIPPLPEVTRTLSERAFGYAIKRVDVDNLSDERLASSSPLLLITEESKQVIKDFCENFSVENQLKKPTPWIQNLIDRIDERREEERENLERHRYSIWYTP